MSADCYYCHLPLPSALRPKDDEPAYCCFGCRLAADITAGHGDEGHATWMLARLGTAVVLSMAVMVFSLPLYGLDVYGESVAPDGVLAELPGLLRYTSLLATSVVLVLLGIPLLTNALEQIARGIVTTDLLIVFGVSAAIAYSYVSTVTDSGRTYYETACMVLVLVTLGRYLEATGKNRAGAALRQLESLLPDTVELERGGESVAIPRAELSVGETMVVKAGERISADGEVVHGEAHVDEGIVTGESAPVSVCAGHVVRAGTLSIDGLLKVKVTGVGSQSALGRLLEAVEAARRAKTRFERFADRAVRWFLPGVVIVAVIAAVLAFNSAGLDAAIMTGLAVVLISCPCALGIATPLAGWVAVDRAAQHGVVFRSASALEALANVRAVAFDKTGTLTDGDPKVANFEKLESNGVPREELLSLSAALAAGSTHSVSRGVARFAGENSVEPVAVASLSSVPGRGMTAVWNESEVRLGSPTFVGEHAPPLTKIEGGLTATYLGVDGRCVGVFSLTERVRSEAKETIQDLRHLGCETRVLTGDSEVRANQIATELNVPTSASLLPEQKLGKIAEMQHEFGAVAMVGDGLNDTPALTAADVGVAMGCGADVTRDAADVCLLGDDLRGVPWAIALARRATRTMRSNLAWAVAYNMIGIPLAATGRLSPAFAATAMVISSLIVVGNSLRLRQAKLGVSLA